MFPLNYKFLLLSCFDKNGGMGRPDAQTNALGAAPSYGPMLFVEQIIVLLITFVRLRCCHRVCLIHSKTLLCHYLTLYNRIT